MRLGTMKDRSRLPIVSFRPRLPGSAAGVRAMPWPVMLLAPVVMTVSAESGEFAPFLPPDPSLSPAYVEQNGSSTPALRPHDPELDGTYSAGTEGGAVSGTTPPAADAGHTDPSFAPGDFRDTSRQPDPERGYGRREPGYFDSGLGASPAYPEAGRAYGGGFHPGTPRFRPLEPEERGPDLGVYQGGGAPTYRPDPDYRSSAVAPDQPAYRPQAPGRSQYRQPEPEPLPPPVTGSLYGRGYGPSPWDPSRNWAEPLLPGGYLPQPYGPGAAAGWGWPGYGGYGGYPDPSRSSREYGMPPFSDFWSGFW